MGVELEVAFEHINADNDPDSVHRIQKPKRF